MKEKTVYLKLDEIKPYENNPRRNEEDIPIEDEEN